MSKRDFPALNLGCDLFQLSLSLGVVHDRRRFQQNMTGVNLGNGDILGTTAQVVDFQNVETNAGTNRTDDIPFLRGA
ncbi:Uncharacterised protein [Klebsiella pneumoniae]|nr:Uncharacterised protein [Klebsiella pneumoniae]